MITIQNIREWSKPHSIGGGRRTCIYNDAVEMSIVGGATGLYGDFENDFEIAIFDRSIKDFVTKYFFPENGDDVVGYLPSEDLESVVNKIFQSGFQVR
jgi:hypothetical protein